jgi:hypothetical protein
MEGLYGDGAIKLSKIGSVKGLEGNFNIFGVLYKKKQ